MKTAKITATLTALLAMLLLASSASAYSLQSFEASTSTAAAGGHPDLVTDLVFPNKPLGGPFFEVEGNVRDATVELPAGMVGDPTAVPQCLQSEFAAGACPPESQVGVADVSLIFPNGFKVTPKVPLFNMQPLNSDQTADLAFSFLNIIAVQLPISVRTDGDYGLTIDSTGISRADGVAETKITTWGVPGDSSHESEWITMAGEPTPPGQAPPRVPFFTNPTRCDAPLGFSAKADSYQEYGAFGPASTYVTPQLTSCDELDFAPTLKARPTTNATDSPTGLDVDLKLPQNLDPAGTAESELKDVQMTLPEGLVLNPSSANGLGACTPQQIGLTTPVGAGRPSFALGKPNCPAASRLGSVEVDTPVFDDPLKGSVFLASPHQNPFGSLLALYLTIEGHGLAIRLAGKVSPDPKTGRLTASFEDNPQQPFEHLRVKFDGGSAAALRTPPTCGKYATTSVMSAWSAPETPAAAPKDEYEITRGSGGSACGAPANAPSFEAGSTSPIAGANAPFVINLSRPDGSQELASLTVKPPAGLLAKLAGVPYCPDAALAAAAGRSGKEEQAAASCPAASQVGTVDVAAGAGPAPFNAPGKVYLAGPYKGAPISLAVVTPAVAGPFDLGTVVVRNALHIDPTSTEVTAVSDPIPSILQGIPLDIRQIRLRLDRPSFTVNPTSCDPSAVTGSAVSLLNQSAPLQSRFQVGECGRLGFKPKLKLSLRGQTKRTGNPGVRAVLTAPKGQANIASTTVVLPKGEFIDNSHISSPCTRVQFDQNACPPKSILGTARAYSPLLDKPLEGPVYFRSNGGERELPDMVADLQGQIHVTLVGFIDSVAKKGSEQSRVRTRFLNVPDAPVSRFELSLYGGKRGLLQNSVNLCRVGLGKARLTLGAHNGVVREYRHKVGTNCHKKKGKKKHRGGGR